MSEPHTVWVAFLADGESNKPIAVGLDYDECNKIAVAHWKKTNAANYMREFVQTDGKGNQKNPTLSELLRMVADKMEESK